MRRRQNPIVAAAIRGFFLKSDDAAATPTCIMSPTSYAVAGPLDVCTDAAWHDVLAYMLFPEQHRVELRNNNPLERLNNDVKRCADVIGIFLN